MITHILVATDGSPNAGRATDFAIDLASRYQARLSVVYAITSGKVSESLRHMAEVEHIVETGSAARMPATVTFPSHLVAELGETGARSRAVLAKIGDHLVEKVTRQAHEHGVKKVDVHVENGDAAEVILRVAEEQAVDVIVTGSRGLGNLRSLFLGSVSYKVLQTARCNCITVK